MAKVAVIGAGFSGQIAVLYLRNKLGREHEVTMINPTNHFTYTPSLIWVGIDQMGPERVQFDLKKVYDKQGINFVQGWARDIYTDDQYVLVEKADDHSKVKVEFDYLVNATGPYLNFEGIEGLGPEEETTYSVCTVPHTVETRDKYLEQVKRLENGESVTMVFGTGHGGSTCQGAAFEYIMNIDTDLRKRGLRDRAKLVWFSNEPKLGDFGVGGINARKNGYIMQSETFTKSVFAEKDIYYQIHSAPTKVEEGKLYYEDGNGEAGMIEFDFAMLIPQFKGIPMTYIDKDGNDITDQMTNPAGFMKVDGNYGKAWEDLRASDWPKKYQSPIYNNIFAAGIAFAPPGTVSKPTVNPNGVKIAPAIPRTGMASGIIGRVAALNIVDMINGKEPSHEEPMSHMPSACIASIGKSLWNGSASSMVMFPTVPDYDKYPDYGRDLSITSMEVGLGGAWVKRILHTTFLYKMQANPGWTLIPE